MSDSNRVVLQYCEETIWGTTPATRNLSTIRMTGESLGYNVEYISSNEIRDDRQVTDLIQTGADAGGGIQFELSYSSFDDFLEGALMSDWSDDLGISIATITASKTNSQFTSASTPFEDVVSGQWIKVAGFDAASGGNNGFYLVTAAAPGTLTVSPAPATAETNPTGGVTISGSYLRNGTTEHSYSIQRKVADITPNVFFKFSGMMVNQLSMSVQANSILTGSLDFIGKSCSVGTGSMSSGSVGAATTTTVMNAVANVANILENNTAVASCLVRGIDFSLNNNLRGLDAIGQLGNCEIGVGQVSVTGTLDAYFKNKDLVAKYIAGTETSLSFRVTDAAGNAYIVTFHRVKFSADTVNTPGGNQDMMENISWTAFRHATYGCTVQIDKFAA